ncbi:MAG TPA: maleylpyruvate isomerase N-terminal domain-containing protein [Streptosporangiaceae bacterium]|nr:maleylpyruvate isomerase N-terminal domain-containing protein [Streptosporangiaceae bacterium]
MDDSRYLECLAADYGDLRDAATTVELTVPVPTCPGWTMGDLVLHVAQVYLHKVTVMRAGEWPTQWPPPGAEHQAELPLLARAYGELIAEFRARQPTDPTPTWYDPDQTVAFWIRRMAQETVVHRIDAELAAGLPVTPVPDDLALDGVDEVLKRFLAYDPEDLDQLEGGHLARAGQDTITVLAGQTAWTVRPAPPEVVVDDGASDRARVVIQAAPDAMLRWLWGRAGDDAVQVTGDPEWAAYLRRMLVAATQ